MKRMTILLMLTLLLSLNVKIGLAMEKTLSQSNSTDSVLASTPIFVNDTPHRSTIAYLMYFNILSAKSEALTLSIQDSIYNNKLGAELWERVTNDLRILSESTSILLKPLTIYVVKETLNGLYYYDDKVYCTVEDIDSGFYRQALVGVSFAINEPWKKIGLANHVFCGSADEAMLQEYYRNSENMDVLSLFAAYFVDTFASQEETYIAQQTATALCG